MNATCKNTQTIKRYNSIKVSKKKMRGLLHERITMRKTYGCKITAEYLEISTERVYYYIRTVY